MKNYMFNNKYIKNNNFFILFIIMFISLIYVEILFKYFAFKQIYGLELIRIFLFTIFTSLIISFFASLFKKMIAKTIVLTTIFFSSIYAITQLNFKNFMGNYMSLNATSDGIGRVTNEIKAFILYINPFYLLLLVPFLLIFVLFNKLKLIYHRPKYLSIIKRTLLIISIHLISLSTLYIPFFQTPTQIKDNKTLYKNPVLIELSLKQFGIIRFFVRDFIYIFNKHEEFIVIDKTESEESPPVAIPDYTREIDDTQWKNIMKNEKNKQINKLHEFYINQNITIKNDMTGMFKDKNLIYIMVEAFDMIAINEQLTPTLYKLSTEGITFDNYYAPKYSCTTGESEFISLMSIIPSLTLCTPNSYKNNNYSTSLFQLFSNNDYFNTSYHNYSDKYYHRKTLHKNMGSLKFYNDEDLAINKILGWPSDLNLMEEALPHFINEEKFMSFIITSSMHFPYDEDGHVGVVLKHWDKVKKLPYNNKIKRYMAKAIEFDLSIKYLLEQLKSKNILDDTVIVLFGDHHPLNMEYKYLNEASPIDRIKDFNIDKLPFIIYNNQIEPMTVNKTASTFDIVPTIANLFDLNYDPRYYIGKDLFSKEETIVIFSSGSWITDKAIYYSSTGHYKELQAIDEDYINEVNKKVNNYFLVSDQTLVLDYFKYRFPNN